MLGIKQKKNLLGILELQWHKYSDFAFNIIFMIIFNSRKTNKQQQKQLLGMVLWQAFFNTSLRVQNWIRIRLTSLKKAWSLVVWGYLSPQVQWDNYFHKMEKAMAPHSSTLAWRILWMEEPGRLQSMGSRRSDTTERLHFHFSPSCIGEGNGNPLQCSCLENPRDGGAWRAAVYGVAQSQTRLKQLSSSKILIKIYILKIKTRRYMNTGKTFRERIWSSSVTEWVCY